MPKFGPPKDIEFYDFSGGVNVADSEFMLRPNELSDSLNVLPTTRGALEVRKGYAAYNSTRISPGTIFGMAKFYREGAAAVLVVSCDEKLWSVPTSGASTNLGAASGYTVPRGARNPIFFAQYRNRLFASASNRWAGGVANSKMAIVANHPDGTGNLLAWAWGVTTPTNAPTCAESDPSGVVDGNVCYKYTFRYGVAGGHGESNPSPASSVYAASTEKVAVTVFGAGKDFATWEDAENGGVGSVYIYRTKAGGSVYYYCGEMTDSTEAFVDNVADADLDATTSPPSDNFGPDYAKYCCVHEERVFIGGLHDGTDEYPKRVRWSQAGFPDIFPNLNYVDSPTEHGDIMGLKVLNGILYVFFESAIGALRVYGEADVEFRIVSNEVGPIAPKTIVVARDAEIPCVFYLGRDLRVYRFDGMTATPISRAIDKYLDATHGSIASAPYSRIVDAAAGYDGEYYYLHPYLNAVASRTVYEFRYSVDVRTVGVTPRTGIGTWWVVAWTYEGDDYSVIPMTYCRFNGGEDVGELLVAGDGLFGRVFFHDSGYHDYHTTDNGITITAQDIPFSFSTGRMNLGLAGHVKSPVKLLMDKESADDITIKWEGGVDGTPTQSFTSEADEVRTRHKFSAIQPAYSFKYTISGTSTAAASLPKIHGFVQRFMILRED